MVSHIIQVLARVIDYGAESSNKKIRHDKKTNQYIYQIYDSPSNSVHLQYGDGAGYLW